jgi:hypothetical protein
LANETLITRLSKIKALADSGVGGEKSAAQALLHDLLRKNGLTLADLDAAEDVFVTVSCDCVFDRKLLIQIVAIVTGRPDACTISGERVGFRCTPAESTEIDAMFGFYRQKLAADLKNTFYAFLDVNDLYPDTDDAQCAPAAGNAQIDKISGILTRHAFRKSLKKL